MCTAFKLDADFNMQEGKLENRNGKGENDTENELYSSRVASPE